MAAADAGTGGTVPQLTPPRHARAAVPIARRQRAERELSESVQERTGASKHFLERSSLARRLEFCERTILTCYGWVTAAPTTQERYTTFPPGGRRGRPGMLYKGFKRQTGQTQPRLPLGSTSQPLALHAPPVCRLPCTARLCTRRVRRFAPARGLGTSVEPPPNVTHK